jgi:hypothetical protein
MDRLVEEAEELRSPAKELQSQTETLVVELPEDALIAFNGHLSTGDGDEHGSN